MEPNDLKSPAPDDAQLETWLRANASLPPLPDDGFSNHVLATLPSPTRRRTSLRLYACLGGAAAGLVVAAWPVLDAGGPLDHLPSLDAALVHGVEQLASPAASLALLATLGTLAFVFWRNLRHFVRL